MSNNYLLDLIKSKGLKTGKLALEAGITNKSYASQIFHGDRPIPESLNKVLVRYGIGLATLTNEDVIRPKSEPKTTKTNIPKNIYEIFKEFKKAEPVSDSALRNYDKSIGRFLKTNPVNSSSEDIITYLKQFKGNKYGYANRHFHWRNLRTFYKFLYMKYDHPNPLVTPEGEYLVPEPYVDKESVQPSITKEEINQLVKSDRLNSRDKLLIMLPYSSSMRISEWSELEVEDIDYNRGMINEVAVKGRHLAAKTIVQAIPYIRAYLADTGITSGRLFQATAKYKALHARGIEKSFKEYIQPKAREITGNPKLVLTPHVFRRGFARLMQESKIPDTVGMQLGGWKSQKMYKKYGNSLTTEDASRIANEAIKDIFNVGLPTLNPE